MKEEEEFGVPIGINNFFDFKEYNEGRKKLLKDGWKEENTGEELHEMIIEYSLRLRGFTKDQIIIVLPKKLIEELISYILKGSNTMYPADFQLKSTELSYVIDGIRFKIIEQESLDK